jgi:hypothetical protein
MAAVSLGSTAGGAIRTLAAMVLVTGLWRRVTSVWAFEP